MLVREMVYLGQLGPTELLKLKLKLEIIFFFFFVTFLLALFKKF